MEHFIISLEAIFPFFVYIFYGYIMRRAGIVTEPFLEELSGVIFRVFFPFITFYNIYKIDPGLPFRPAFIGFCAAMVFLLIAVLLLTVPLFVKDPRQAGVVIQAVYRSNAVLYALPLAESVYGSQGASCAAMAIAVVVPVYNVTAVFILEHFCSGSSDKKVLFRKILTNPLIVGAAAGALFLLLHIPLPAMAEKPVSAFNTLSTPLALFALGGTLHFSEIRKNLRLLLAGLTAKMVLIPAVVLALSLFAGFMPAERFVIFAVFATPPAASSFPMAAAMGGDGELAGQFVVIGTALSLVTLFFWISLMSGFGLL